MRYRLEIKEDPKEAFSLQQYSYLVIDTLTGNTVNACSTKERAEWHMNRRNGKEQSED